MGRRWGEGCEEREGVPHAGSNHDGALAAGAAFFRGRDGALVVERGAGERKAIMCRRPPDLLQRCQGLKETDGLPPRSVPSPSFAPTLFHVSLSPSFDSLSCLRLRFALPKSCL